MEKRELVCVTCPIGCVLEVTTDGGKVVSVRGNTCKRGEGYAIDEVTAPKRVLTTTVRCESGGMVSVRTTAPILRDGMFDAMRVINALTAPSGVCAGDVLVKDVAGLGADVIATKSAEEAGRAIE